MRVCVCVCERERESERVRERERGRETERESVCVCVCVCTHVLRIVSMDKILHFITTLIISIPNSILLGPDQPTATVFPEELHVSPFPRWVPTLCPDSTVSPLWLHWISGACVFTSVISICTLAEWPRSFTYHCECDNTGVGQISQSMFYYMSVHTEVILDNNNKNKNLGSFCSVNSGKDNFPAAPTLRIKPEIFLSLVQCSTNQLYPHCMHVCQICPVWGVCVLLMSMHPFTIYVIFYICVMDFSPV